MAQIPKSKAYLGMVVLLIVGLVIGAVAGYSLAPPKEVVKEVVVGLTGEVKIGALLPLSGALSSYGENSKVALELAEKHINDYLKASGAKFYVKIYVEDTATDPKTCFDKIQVLHGKGIKFIVGPQTSAEVKEVKSYADANKILLISQSSTSPALAIKDDWIFRFCPHDEKQGPAAARVAWELGVRALVIVWRGDTWGDGLRVTTKASFEKLLKKYGEAGEAIEFIRYDPAAKEFSAEAASLAKKVEDLAKKYPLEKIGVGYIAFEEAVAFFAAARAHPVLWKVKWIGSDGTAGLGPFVDPKNKDVIEFSIKVNFISPIFAPGWSPWFEQVRSYVKGKLGRVPDSYAYAAYDAAWAIVLALLAVGEYSPEKVKAILPEVVARYTGATGSFTLDEAGDRATGDYELWVVVETAPGKYEWKSAGMYYGATDSITWEPWFKF